MNNLTEQEAFAITEFISTHLFSAIKQDEVDDIEWLATLIHGYEKLSECCKYDECYDHSEEPEEDESDDTGAEPWQIVYFTLFDNYPMLRGCYDAKHGDEHYMYGVELVMEIIAEKAGRQKQFNDVFSQNMKKSLEKAGKF